MTITKVNALSKSEVKKAIIDYQNAYDALIDLLPYEEENTRAIREQISSMKYHLEERLGELEAQVTYSTGEAVGLIR